MTRAGGQNRTYDCSRIFFPLRHLPWALAFFGIALLGGGSYAAWRGYRGYRRSQALQSRIQALASDRFLLARVDGHVEPLNPPARRWLRPGGKDGTKTGPADELTSWIESLDPSFDQSAQAEISEGPGRDETVRVSAHLLPAYRGEPARWLVRADPPPGSSGLADGLEENRTWRLMARRVAHDLKNPLTSILLAVRRLQNEQEDRAPELAQDLRPYTERIESRIRRLRRMTLNFMKLAGGEGPSLARGHLGELAESVAERLRKDLASDITLEVSVEEDLPATSFDRDQIESVLENLVSNAADALSEGGEITLSVWLERGLQPDPNAAPGDYAVIEVVDTGEGMDPETVRRAVEPGYSTSEEGAGLGLPIVKKIVEDHGGIVDIESEKGLGTAVTLYLPVSGRPRDGAGDVEAG